MSSGHGDDEITVEEARRRGWTEDANLDAEFPSGMCGEPKVCEECPSQFICTMKASKEMAAIKARKARRTWRCNALVTIADPETSTFVGLDAEFEVFTDDGNEPTQAEIDAIVVQIWAQEPDPHYSGYGVFNVKPTLTEI